MELNRSSTERQFQINDSKSFKQAGWRPLAWAFSAMSSSVLRDRLGTCTKGARTDRWGFLTRRKDKEFGYGRETIKSRRLARS